MKKDSFFDTPEFNCWLITSFFTIFVSVVLVILPAWGLECLVNAASDELSQYSHPPVIHPVPTERPSTTRARGIPVALNQGEQR